MMTVFRRLPKYTKILTWLLLLHQQKWKKRKRQQKMTRRRKLKKLNEQSYFLKRLLY
jgi:hypothetical protein